VVQGAGAAALLAVTGKHGRARNQAGVVVIGAGLSGLNVALLLEEQGVDVQVIEGRTRVGGRIKTLDDIPGNPEAGGFNFGGGYARLFDALDRFGLEAWDWTDREPNMRRWELGLDGEIVAPADWPDHPRNPFPDPFRETMPWAYYFGFIDSNMPLAAPEDWQNPKHFALDVSLHDWMRDHGQTDAIIEIACNMNWQLGNSANDVSALLAMFEYSWGKAVFADRNRPGSFVIKGGNKQLPEAMAAALNKEVHFGKEVVGIRSEDDAAEVHCADGTVYRADHVICSIPFAVLRKLQVDPVLTGAQGQAVWSLDRQLVTQVHLVPTAPFWEADGLSPGMFTDGPAGFMLPIFGHDDPDELTSLQVWLLGPDAERADQLDEQSATGMVVSAIENLRPAAKGKLEVAGYKSWYRDPFSAGDWAVFRPGQVSRFVHEMATPHGRIHFCGEHTALANRGMEAAMESGERAAIEILQVI
jgi:monoamine oxidase